MSQKLYELGHQFLLVSLSKHHFLDAKGKFFEVDMERRKPLDWRPLLILSLVEPALRVWNNVFMDPRRPIALSAFLAKSWRECGPLEVPFVMTMHRGLHTSDEGFLSWIHAQGIRTVAANEIPDVRSVAALTRSASHFKMYTRAMHCELDLVNREVERCSAIHSECSPPSVTQQIANHLEWQKLGGDARSKRTSSAPALQGMDWNPPMLISRPISFKSDW